MRIALLCIITLIFNNIVFAAQEIVEVVGQYKTYGKELDNPIFARSMAEKDAIRLLKEKAGFFLVSYSKTDNFVLSEDDIATITGEILSILEKKHEKLNVGDSSIYNCHLKGIVEIDSNRLKEILKAKENIEEDVERFDYDRDYNFKKLQCIVFNVNLSEKFINKTNKKWLSKSFEKQLAQNFNSISKNVQAYTFQEFLSSNSKPNGTIFIANATVDDCSETGILKLNIICMDKEHKVIEYTFNNYINRFNSIEDALNDLAKTFAFRTYNTYEFHASHSSQSKAMR